MAEAPLAADIAGALLKDSELVVKARQGDRRAFGTLYLRHHGAAWRVACAAASSGADAEDAVAEGFTKVFAALPRIVDRDIAFRPYLLACVRNAATDRHRRGRRIDLTDEVPEARASLGPAEPGEIVLADLERNLVGEALKSLPERWRTVLWLTEVEGMTPTEVSAVIGLKPNAVAALAYRAREGLREAYLQAHVRAEAKADCRYTVDRLGPYVRGELADRERQRVQAHLDGCAPCRQRRDELADVNAGLLGALAPVPLVLGSRTQQEWLAGSAGRSKGARRVRPPARAAKVAAVATSDLVQKGMAVVVALLLVMAGGAALNRFSGNDPDRVPLAQPPKGPAVPFNAAPPAGGGGAEAEEAAAGPLVRSGGASRRVRPSSPAVRPSLAGPALSDTAAPLGPVSAPAGPPTPPDTGPAPASEVAPTPPAPGPAPKPTPAAATAASFGQGSTGAVVGASVPDEEQDPEAQPALDVTVGESPIVGDAQPSEGTAVSAEGSSVPPEVSDAANAVSGAVPVDEPAAPAAPQSPDVSAPPAPPAGTPAADRVPGDTPAADRARHKAPTGASTGGNSNVVAASAAPAAPGLNLF